MIHFMKPPYYKHINILLMYLYYTLFSSICQYQGKHLTEIIFQKPPAQYETQVFHAPQEYRQQFGVILLNEDHKLFVGRRIPPLARISVENVVFKKTT